MTRDLALDLIDYHVPELRTALEPLLLPSIRIRTNRLAYDGSKLASKFGGLPLMPPDLPWPTWDPRPCYQSQIRRYEQSIASSPGSPNAYLDKALAEMRSKMTTDAVPLAFLGQVLLDELPKLPLFELPRTGRLLFFYDLQTDPGSFDPASRGSGKVLYVSDTSRDTIRPAPPSLPPDWSFTHTATMNFENDWTVPDDPRSERVAYEYRTHGERYLKLLADLYGERGPIHRLGGHSQPVQNDMRLEAQLVTHGLYCGDAAGYKDPRAEALKDGAKDWQLLLQIDTDEDGFGWMWGDAGMFYIWIRQQDLAAQNFDHVFCSMQCH
jgi:uncharacterized protein YwqG